MVISCSKTKMTGIRYGHLQEKQPHRRRRKVVIVADSWINKKQLRRN